MKKGMTYEELQAYAQAYYNKGGDVIVECWDRRAFDEYVGMFGPITKRTARAMFRMNAARDREIAASVW